MVVITCPAATSLVTCRRQLDGPPSILLHKLEETFIHESILARYKWQCMWPNGPAWCMPQSPCPEALISAQTGIAPTFVFFGVVYCGWLRVNDFGDFFFFPIWGLQAIKHALQACYAEDAISPFSFLFDSSLVILIEVSGCLSLRQLAQSVCLCF